jgi:hypothetical protein
MVEVFMAHVQSTFPLDAESTAMLSELARRWQTSETEVLRRVLHDAAQREQRASIEEKLAALHQLQKDMAGTDFDAWRETIRNGRR